MVFYIMKGARNRDAAFQLIQYLMTADALRQIFTISAGYVYPAREWGWDAQELTVGRYAQHITPVWKQILNDPGGFIGTAWPGPQTPQAGALDSSNFWTDMFGEILVGKPVEDTLQSWHDRAVQTFKEFGAKGE
jgi:ABC-type glycerol-3-phosphate transport system substrate-binding protein